MGSMFIEESWLEMTPSLDKQAGMLAGLKNIRPEDFDRVSITLQRQHETATLLPADKAETVQPPPAKTILGTSGDFSNPKSFLLAVMNDPTAHAEHRIRAAIALLPFFANDSEK